MFRKISKSIALRFTVFVFLLMLMNGIIFLAADFGNARRDMRFRMDRSLGFVMEQIERMPMIAPQELPPPIRDRMRVVDALGKPLFTSPLFQDVPFVPTEGYGNVMIDDEPYRMLTARVQSKGQILGYVQIADLERVPLSGLPARALLFFVVTILVSALTYIVGNRFARRSLKPAQETMERLEQFTQDASHELRTPIAALHSSLDLALKTKKYHEGILSAKDDLRAVSSLVERLLDLARLDKLALELEHMDLSAIVEDAVERHRALALEKHVEITTTIAQRIHTRGDVPLVRQLIGNLIGNAIKFNKEGGTVHVTLTKDVLTIADTGIGMAPSAIPHIFDRFYQADTSRSNNGFGLGLAFVKRVVDIHGWKITVKSVEGEGTAFRVRFS